MEECKYIVIHIICIVIDIIVNFGLSKLRLNNHSNAQKVMLLVMIKSIID